MFFLGFLYANMMEWVVHKFLFHEMGKNKNSVFAFHLREHHINCLKNNNRDRNFSSRELPGILFLLFLHCPIYFLLPMFYYGLCLYGSLFVIVHNLAHIKTDLGKKLFPWHWDHHMKHQNHNFNVVIPIADYLLGTRKKT